MQNSHKEQEYLIIFNHTDNIYKEIYFFIHSFNIMIANVQMEPTIRASAPFNPEADATALKTAMAGLVTIDKKAIVNIVGKRNNKQRLEIAAKYKTMFGKV
jgi:hypothetical protein